MGTAVRIDPGIILIYKYFLGFAGMDISQKVAFDLTGEQPMGIL